MAKRKHKKVYQKLQLKLSSSHRRKLRDLFDHGHNSARLFRRAMILQFLDHGESAEKVSAKLGVTPTTARNVGRKYIKFGLRRALYDSPRPGKKPLINSHQEKEIIAVVCSAPVKQRSRWTLELLREEVIRRKIISRVSRDTIRRLLHDCQVKPWLEKKLVRWGPDRRIHPENGEHS